MSVNDDCNLNETIFQQNEQSCVSTQQNVQLPVIVLNKNTNDTTIPMNTHLIKINAFLNLDGVSCYANATIQCLINCIEWCRKFIVWKNCIRSDDLPQIVKSYFLDKSNSPRTSQKLRDFAGGTFLMAQQQDVYELIDELASKSNIFKKSIQNRIIIESICQDCGEISISMSEINYLIFDCTQIANQNNTINLLMERYKKPGIIHEGYKCPNPLCQHMDSNIREYEFAQCNDLLLIYCNVFQYDVNIKQMKKIENIKYENIPDSEIVINSTTYKFNSAIFHIGRSITNGHYISIVRTENGFVECNDSLIKSCNWPHNALYKSGSVSEPTNLYMLVYEKMNN